MSPPEQKEEKNGHADVEFGTKIKNEKNSRKRIKFVRALLVLEAAFIVLFACFARYDGEVVPKNDWIVAESFVARNGSLAGELAEEELYPVKVETLRDDVSEGSGEVPRVAKKIREKVAKKKSEKKGGEEKKGRDEKKGGNEKKVEDAKKDEDGKRDPHLESVLSVFQDVHVMIFIGFGFLMTFLKKYGCSAVGVSMLLAAIVLQWATLCQGFFDLHAGKIIINITNLLNADFASATVLISFGALVGKTSPLQLLAMTIIEIVLFSVNKWIALHVFWTSDVGASVLVHVFGAYFGLMVSSMLYNRSVHNKTNEDTNYHSDIFATIGTIFLWLFWPSFNSALAAGHARQRAVINTYFSLAASCVTSFAVSAAVDKHNRFNMVHVQNSALAGGVAIGTAADLMIQPYGALLVGIGAGVVSVLGCHFVTPFLANRLKMHDACGVHNLHGMPGILAGVVGVIMAAMASEDEYGEGLYNQYPMRAPLNGTRVQLNSLEAGRGWSSGKQASYQAAALVTTLAFAIIGGLITGLVLRRPFFDPPTANKSLDNDDFWEVAEEEPLVLQNGKQDDVKV